MMVFIFLSSFAALYAEQHFTPSCACVFPPWIFIITFSSLGVFVGSLVYYFLLRHYIAEKRDVNFGLKKLLSFMDINDKKIIEILLKNSGKISQSKLSEISKIDKVTLSRKINNLVSKDILKKEKNGMSNTIILDNSLYEIMKDIFPKRNL